MQDIESVQFLKAQRDLDERPPDCVLFKQRLLFLVLHDLLVEVAIIRKLHHDAA